MKLHPLCISGYQSEALKERHMPQRSDSELYQVNYGALNIDSSIGQKETLADSEFLQNT